MIKRYHYVYRITNILFTPYIYYYGTRTTSKLTEVLPKDDIGIKYFSSKKDKSFELDRKENPQNYKYKVIKIFDTRKEALALEIYLHNKFNVKLHKQFYNESNQTSIGFDTTGNKEVGKKISLSKKGNVNTKNQVTVRTLDGNVYNVTCEEYHINKGIIYESVCKNTVKTLEVKKKISLAIKHAHKCGIYDNRPPVSQETKLKISISKSGLKQSKESINKRVLKNTGQKRSVEQKKRMSEAQQNKENTEWTNERKIHQSSIMKIKVICPHCNKEGQKSVMNRWHFDKCKVLKEKINEKSIT